MKALVRLRLPFLLAVLSLAEFVINFLPNFESAELSLGEFSGRANAYQSIFMVPKLITPRFNPLFLNLVSYNHLYNLTPFCYQLLESNWNLLDRET